MKRHGSQILGLPIVTLAEGAHLGFVTDIFFDPEKGKVLAFLASFGKVFGPMDTSAWHSNRVEVFNEEALVLPEEISRLQSFGIKRTRLLKKKVLFQGGKKVGHVCDFCLDSATSSLLSIEACKSFLWWQWDSRIFQFSDIKEIAEDAVLLNVDPEQTVKTPAKESSDRKNPVRLSPVSTSRDF